MSNRLVGRRAILGGAAAVAAGATLGSGWSTAAHAARIRTDPFALGIASGDPLSDGVVLWTRLVADPLDASSLTAENVLVAWEVARDPSFAHPVRGGWALASARNAHSVHVDVRGLQPDHEYFYRFKTGQYISPAGRTRTLPEPWRRASELTFGVVNCQDFQNGYFSAYAALADEDLDLVLHVGDYIYEYDPHSTFADRNHTTPQTPGLDQLLTLSDYRARHAQYKGDASLQAAHAAFPWVVTWDDHETENNYAGLIDEIDDTAAMKQDVTAFAQERAAAYQAYWEHMPLRPVYTGGPNFRIFRRFDVGDLVRFNVLDTRQYRTDQPGNFPGDFGLEVAGTSNATGTMMSAAEEAWLDDGLSRSHTRWNVIAQQVMMARTRFPDFLQIPGVPTISNLDQWDGYVPARQRLLNYLASQGVLNPVVLSGDIHSTWFNDLRINPDDLASNPVGVEFVATSVTSDFPVAFDAPLKAANPFLNPNTKYFDGLLHGYLRCDVTRERWQTDVRNVASITTPTSPVATTTSWVVEAGQPGLVPA